MLILNYIKFGISRNHLNNWESKESSPSKPFFVFTILYNILLPNDFFFKLSDVKKLNLPNRADTYPHIGHMHGDIFFIPSLFSN